MLNLAFIQYLFTEGEHDVKDTPMEIKKGLCSGNAKCTEKFDECCDPQHS